jgi:hypothetical protein
MFECHYCDLEFYDTADRFEHEKDAHVECIVCGDPLLKTDTTDIHESCMEL